MTGGGRGIGRTIAFALAQAEADVAVASRNEQAFAEVAREIATTTGRVAVSSKLNVTEKNEPKRLSVQQTRSSGQSISW